MRHRTRVSVRNTETAADYQTVTTATGDYTLSQLPEGNSELSVAVPGFKKFVQRGIVVVNSDAALRA